MFSVLLFISVTKTKYPGKKVNVGDKVIWLAISGHRPPWGEGKAVLGPQVRQAHREMDRSKLHAQFSLLLQFKTQTLALKSCGSVAPALFPSQHQHGGLQFSPSPGSGILHPFQSPLAA